jgi:D-sedoheptulose 7-phosphate isomerase
MNNVDKIFVNTDTKANYASKYIEYLVKVLRDISTDEISTFIDVLLTAREKSASIYFIGNGGSAATASHFANDISIGTRCWDKPFRTISLCDNSAIITAIGNDDGYDKIFSQQLSVLLKEGDVVVAISASGNSPNLLEAINISKEIRATTVGLTSFDGGKLRQMVDYSVHVPAQKGEYGPAEDAHMVLDHLVGSYLMRYVKS